MNITQPLLIVNAISKSVSHSEQQLLILQNISFQVKTQETLAIVGSSGSGKSTLLAIISGLDHASSGEVTVLGHNFSQLTEDQRAKFRLENIGFVFQNFQLMPTMTALENVMLPLELAKQTNVEQRARDILTRVGLPHRLDHYPKHLSGGEQQRVAIARAFVSRPKILFADEPTGSLDAKSATAIVDLLFELNHQHGTVLILVTHDMQLAKRCQRQLLLNPDGLHEVMQRH